MLASIPALSVVFNEEYNKASLKYPLRYPNGNSERPKFKLYEASKALAEFISELFWIAVPLFILM